MDQTYEELQVQRARSKQNNNVHRIFVSCSHRVLVLLLAALFYFRTIVATVFWAAQVVVLAPYAGLACLLYRLWAIDKQVCGSELSLTRVYAGFWAGDKLVLGTSLESFLLRSRDAAPVIAPLEVEPVSDTGSARATEPTRAPAADALTLTLTKHQMNAIKRLLRRQPKPKKCKPARKRRLCTRSATLTAAPATLPRRRLFKRRK